MIKFYSRLKNGAPVTVKKEFSKASWVFVENPNAPEVEYLVKNLKLDEGLVQDAIDVDEAPRLEVENGLLYLFARFAYTDSLGDIKTAPSLFVVGKGFIVTITTRPKSIYRVFADENSSYITSDKMDLVINLFRVSIESYTSRLNTISRHVRSIRSNLSIDKVSNKDFIQLVEVGDVLNEFIGDIGPINNVLQILAKNKQTQKFNEQELDVIEDLYLSANQLLDNSKSALKTIVNIRDSYANIATNNLNKKITMLTTLTVVLTIPTIVGSFWGMNVGVPFRNGADSFLIIITVTLLLVGVTLLWLKSKQWF
jgi:magnesium transporter